MEASHQIGTGHARMPIVSAPLETERTAFAVLMDRPALRPVAWANIRWGIRKRVRVGQIDLPDAPVDVEVDIYRHDKAIPDPPVDAANPTDFSGECVEDLALLKEPRRLTHDPRHGYYANPAGLLGWTGLGGKVSPDVVTEPRSVEAAAFARGFTSNPESPMVNSRGATASAFGYSPVQ